MKDVEVKETSIREYFRPRREGEPVPPVPEPLSLWGKRTLWGVLGGAALGFTQGLRRARVPTAHPLPAHKAKQRLSYFVTQGMVTNSVRIGLFVAIYSAVDLAVREWLRDSPSEPVVTNCVLCQWSRSTGTEQSSGLAAGALTGFLFRLPMGSSLALAGAAYGAGLGFAAGSLERWLRKLEHAVQTRRSAPQQPNVAIDTSDDLQEAATKANAIETFIQSLQERIQPDHPAVSNHRTEHEDGTSLKQNVDPSSAHG